MFEVHSNIYIFDWISVAPSKDLEVLSERKKGNYCEGNFYPQLFAITLQIIAGTSESEIKRGQIIIRTTFKQKLDTPIEAQNCGD